MEYNLENIKEVIQGIHEKYPPTERTPEIIKFLGELYKIEHALRYKTHQTKNVSSEKETSPMNEGTPNS